jgi:hypothetical protein
VASFENISGDTVAEAALETLKTWLPAYLALQERKEGLPARTLPLPKSYLAAVDANSQMPEDQFPRVMVISPGLAGEPQKGPTGYYSAAFALAAGAAVTGDDREQTRKFMQSYVAAIRNCLITQKLTDLPAILDWTDETYDEIPGARSRSLAGGEVAFVVYVDDVQTLAESPWPDGPPDDPYEEPQDGPAIDEVIVDVDKKENIDG